MHVDTSVLPGVVSKIEQNIYIIIYEYSLVIYSLLKYFIIVLRF